MPAPERIIELVELFKRNFDAYRAPEYKELQVRIEFIDPLFEQLGWDVRNLNGYAEAYKDVVHEPALQVEGLPRAPDYSFRVGGVRKFFVEAKKPAVNVKTDPHSAFQLRRYAWSAKLPLSVLTDFQEFAIYDTRVKPERGEKASKARTFYCTYEEYIDRWDEIAEILSKDAILKGAFDHYVESTKAKRGTAEVDDAFLREIEVWREVLAKDLATRNPKLTTRELNAAVQVTIDRIIFLRISEDRGIEPYERLKNTLKGKGVYPRLVDLFRQADDRYNSGLFHFRAEKGKEAPDRLTPALGVSDQVLHGIIGNLYYPESPYEFAVLPADILGNVYERFLGKTILLDAKHQAQVEERPEIRKAGGVYYTPTYVVRYIVEQTLGRLVSGKHVSEVEKLRVLDPACGSGSFLLVAYQYLLDWHLNWYVVNRLKKFKDRIRQVSDREWRLTTDERKRILLKNIYGVDIDPQAVEVTKLSLLLKVLEGETDESLSAQLTLAVQERALPDLAHNIKNGNSIIGPDFYDGLQIGLLDEEELYRINAFDWEVEFPRIFDLGGFDAVIGNPPYVLLQTLSQKDVFDYLRQRYSAARYKIDTYQVFLEAGLNLIRDGGYLGFITPNSFLRNKFAHHLRKVILEKSNVETLRLFDYPVFRSASVDTVVSILRRTDTPNPAHDIDIVRSGKPQEVRLVGVVPQNVWLNHPGQHFSLPGGELLDRALAKMDSNSIRLGDFADAYFGIQTHDRKKYVVRGRSAPPYKPVVDGVQISRYALSPSIESVEFRASTIKSGGKAAVYEQERIGVRQIGEVPVATLLPAGLYTLNTVYNVYRKTPTSYVLEFVLGLILSKAGQAYWKHHFFDQKRTFPKIKKAALLGFPVPRIDFDVKEDRERHDQLAQLVRQRLDLESEASTASTSSKRVIVNRQIGIVERQIDQAVFTLYGLDGDEVKALDV
jgi:predicted type IV restriction endonuclease